MKIIDKSREFTVPELYRLTKDPEATNLKTHVGEMLEVTGYLIREDEHEDGTQTVISFELSEGATVSSNSPTVRRSFLDILELYQSVGIEAPYPIMITVFSDTARKSGREYINVRMVEA